VLLQVARKREYVRRIVALGVLGPGREEPTSWLVVPEVCKCPGREGRISWQVRTKVILLEQERQFERHLQRG
jgi:hypothetical protein